MTRVLAFGLSGQVGRALRACSPTAVDYTAVSRQAQDDVPGLCWLRGSLEQPPLIEGGFDLVLSLGPLDAFAGWFGSCRLAPGRVIALGSTSVHSRARSPDAREREQAARLAEAESRLVESCRQRAAVLQLLRPTLIYGRGADSSLSLLVALARRYGMVPLPDPALGRRQPVHVDDVAAAVARLMQATDAAPLCLDLPGAEALSFDEMLRRTLMVAAPRARVLRLSPALLAAVLHAAARLGLVAPEAGAFVRRLGVDQVFDPGPAVAAIAWAPRAFQPRVEDFPV